MIFLLEKPRPLLPQTISPLTVGAQDALRDNEHFKWLSKLEALTSWEEWVLETEKAELKDSRSRLVEFVVTAGGKFGVGKVNSFGGARGLQFCCCGGGSSSCDLFILLVMPAWTFF